MSSLLSLLVENHLFPVTHTKVTLRSVIVSHQLLYLCHCIWTFLSLTPLLQTHPALPLLCIVFFCTNFIYCTVYSEDFVSSKLSSEWKIKCICPKMCELKKEIPRNYDFFPPLFPVVKRSNLAISAIWGMLEGFFCLAGTSTRSRFYFFSYWNQTLTNPWPQKDFVTFASK